MKKTILEMFKDIEDLEVAPDNEGEPLKLVKDIVPNWCNKIEQALQRLEAIENSNPSEALSRIEDCLYEDPYADRNDVSYENDIATIKQALLKAQEDEKLKVDICEIFGLDNLFPYNDTKAILKELEEYMGRKNQLWVDFMKTSKKFKEQEKELEEYRLIKRALGHFIYDADSKKWYIEHYYSEHDIKQLHSVRYFGTIVDMKFNLSDYKKTWWLKEDKSE